MTLAAVITSKVANLAGGSVLIAHELDTVNSGSSTSIGTSCIRHIHSFYACVTIVIEERAVVELDTIVDNTKHNTLSGKALWKAIVGAVPGFVGVNDAFSHIGQEACVTGDAHLFHTFNSGYSFKLVYRDLCSDKVFEIASYINTHFLQFGER